MNRIYKQLRHQLSPLRRAYEQLLGCISPRKLADLRFRRMYGRPLDWDNPRDINEKINWLKFNSDTSLWTELADKYRVRNYVEKCGLGETLVNLYGKWDRVEDIDWESLPSRFIMKTNNGSGDVLICRDKSTLDTIFWTKEFSKLLKNKFGYQMAEPHYNKIPPCIIAEELLDAGTQPIPTSSLIDYKIWSFDGKPAYIWTCHNRTHHSVEVMTYDLDWNAHPEYSVPTSHYLLSQVRIPRPECLDRMLEVAAVLSRGFPQVRVDLYEVSGKIYFGELTFASAAGFNDFYTKEFLEILGSHVKLKTQE